MAEKESENTSLSGERTDRTLDSAHIPAESKKKKKKKSKEVEVSEEPPRKSKKKKKDKENEHPHRVNFTPAQADIGVVVNGSQSASTCASINEQESPALTDNCGSKSKKEKKKKKRDKGVSEEVPKECTNDEPLKQDGASVTVPIKQKKKKKKSRENNPSQCEGEERKSSDNNEAIVVDEFKKKKKKKKNKEKDDPIETVQENNAPIVIEPIKEKKKKKKKDREREDLKEKRAAEEDNAPTGIKPAKEKKKKKKEKNKEREEIANVSTTETFHSEIVPIFTSTPASHASSQAPRGITVDPMNTLDENSLIEVSENEDNDDEDNMHDQISSIMQEPSTVPRNVMNLDDTDDIDNSDSENNNVPQQLSYEERLKLRDMRGKLKYMKRMSQLPEIEFNFDDLEVCCDYVNRMEWKDSPNAEILHDLPYARLSPEDIDNLAQKGVTVKRKRWLRAEEHRLKMNFKAFVEVRY